MAIELVRAERLYDGVPYAYASVAPPGAVVFTAGACPLDANEAMAAAGASLTDVLKTTVYVVSGDPAELAAAWDVVRAAFGDHDAPSTLLGVTALGYAGQLVEVEAVAVAGR
jgi:hypothetical protein